MAATGIAFRATSGYVTDGATDTYCVGSADSYPTTRGGITFGWSIASGFEARDRNSGIDARLAGINFQPNDGGQSTLRVDITPGSYSIRLAIGDASNPQAYQYVQIKDDSSAVLTVDDTNGTGNGNFDDATGVEYSPANWPGNNSSASASFASSILNVILGSPASQSESSTLAYIQFVAQVTAKPSHYYQMLRNG